MDSISINAEAMQAVVAKAILDGIDENQKQMIMEAAVKALLKPATEYGRTVPDSTPLHVAMSNAVRQSAFTAAQIVVNDNEVLQERIKDMISDTLQAAMDSNYDLKTVVNEAIIDALSTYAANKHE